MEILGKEFVDHSTGDGNRQDLRLVSLYVRKVVIVNTKTGEITWKPRFTEPFYLNGSISRDAKGYGIKKSLSDGVLETGNYTHVIKESDPKVFAIKDFQDGKGANVNDLTKKHEDSEARAARLKQIEDFFTDPVDRKMFPKQEPESTSTRKFPPIKIPSVEESVSQMLEQFRCAMWNEDLVQEVYRHRVVPRLPPYEVTPSTSEMLSPPSGLLSSTTGLVSPPPGLNSPPPGSVSSLEQVSVDYMYQTSAELKRTHTDVTENQNEDLIAEFSDDEDDEEKNAHKTSWFVKLFCCGGGAASKSNKRKIRQGLENDKKGSWIQIKLRKMFGRQ